MPLSRTERNIKNSIIEGIVKRAINDKEESKKTKVTYGYYPKLLKDCENLLTWINQKNIEYRVKVYENKCASVPNDYPITASIPTEDPVTASVPSKNTVTASFPLIISLLHMQ